MTTLAHPLIDRLTAAYDIHLATVAALQNLTGGDTLPEILDTEGDDIFRWGASWADLADESWDDGGEEHVYRFGDRTFIHDTPHGTWIFDAADIRDFLMGWDADSYGTTEDLLAAFGLDPDLDAADEDHNGPVKIWVSYNYFTGTCNAPRDGWITEDDSAGFPITGQPLIFDSYVEAAAWVAETEDAARGYKSETDPRGCYLLSHGEASPPSFTICRL